MTLINILPYIALAFFISLCLTRLFCHSSVGSSFLDIPNERSLHTQPIPRLGGLAMLISVGLVLLFKGWLHDRTNLWIAAATLTIALTSLWDDRKGLPPVTRITIHLLCALTVILEANIKIDSLSFPVLGTFSLGWLSIPFSLGFIIWMSNLYNFMDGADGLAGGMTLIGFGFLGLIVWQAHAVSMALSSFLLAAASAGFLYYNKPPARIFMGDVGSVAVGFLMGIFALKGITQNIFDIWTPLIVFSPFIVDATTTLIRRITEGDKIWQAHRKHFYQRLVLLGWSHQKTIGAEYLLMASCGFSALLYTKLSQNGRFSLIITWVFIYTFLSYGIRRLEIRRMTGT